jgi:hypothetical protein
MGVPSRLALLPVLVGFGALPLWGVLSQEPLKPGRNWSGWRLPTERHHTVSGNSLAKCFSARCGLLVVFHLFAHPSVLLGHQGAVKGVDVQQADPPLLLVEWGKVYLCRAKVEPSLLRANTSP